MPTARHRVVTVLAGTTVIAVAAMPSVAGATTAVSGHARVANNLCNHADSLPAKLTAAQSRTTTLCLMNAQRTARGLRPLRAHPALAKVATDYARQMAEQRFFAHVSPGGSTLLSRVKSTSYLTRAAGWSIGENIAWGTGPLSTARATVRAWMKSPPHRANLLSSHFDEVGIGLAGGGATAAVNPRGRGTTYVTDFGTRVVRASGARQRR